MLPYITIWGLTIPLYGLMIVLGAGLGFLLTIYKPVYPGLPRQDVVFSAMYVAIGFFGGAKLLYILTLAPLIIRNFERINWNIMLVAEFFTGGFVFYGGLLGGLLMIWIYCKKYQLPFFMFLENLVPALPFIHAWGRLGCFFAGCCYGIPAPAPFGIVFHPDSVAPTGVALFPVQLLEAVLNLLIFFMIYGFSRTKRKSGQIIGLYLLTYTVVRFGLEYLRADEVRGFLFGVSTSQLISIFLFLAGIVLLSVKLDKNCAGQGTAEEKL